MKLTYLFIYNNKIIYLSIFLVFVDLTSAYDRVIRDELYQIL